MNYPRERILKNWLGLRRGGKGVVEIVFLKRERGEYNVICVVFFLLMRIMGLDWFRCRSYLANKQACKSARMQECMIDIIMTRYRTTSFFKEKTSSEHSFAGCWLRWMVFEHIDEKMDEKGP